MHARKIAILALCMAALYACSDDTGSPGGTSNGGNNNGDLDAGGGNNGNNDAGANNGGSNNATNNGNNNGDSDTGQPDDADNNGEDVPAGTRETGELCTSDRECVSSLCLFIEADVDQGFCSQFCFAATDCPDESYGCVFFANSGSDVQYLCVPSDLCIDNDDDSYGFGPGCDDRDCDDNDDMTYPGAPELCDGADNDCDGNVDDNPVDNNMSCATGDSGICGEGTSVCIGGELLCEQNRPSSREICDGLDNDCDGMTDENDSGESLAEVCYSGPPETNGVGACTTGLRQCVDGRSTDCTGQTLPAPETCDGLDNDCDGTTDEDPIDTGAICDTQLPGACARGVQTCANGALTCVPLNPQGAEVCDGRDNDCDGSIDEDDAGQPLTASCYDGPEGTLGVGACTAGARTCAGGEFGTCIDQVTPVDELCDTIDNDCDGTTDEDTLGGGFICNTGLQGVCATGITICTGATQMCDPFVDPDIAAQTPEVCDGLDNDCDGLTDEDDQGAPLTLDCYDGDDGTEGIGACIGGARTCQDGQFGACDGQVIPSVEICDSFDNDCDGMLNEGNPGGNVQCDTQLLGACARGITDCSTGSLSCVQQLQPTAEVCDGIDNDCDGLIDEDDAGQPLTVSCYDGPANTAGVGACTAGTQTCTAGQLGACVGQVLPSAEICDALDNDCDGTVNDGNPGANVQCDTGLDGVCARGITACQNNAIACVQRVQAAPETCDGLDNDCDGSTDEDDAGQPLTVSCYDGPADTASVGACVAGTQTCTDGQYGTCDGQVLPTTEICDALDNDCDGTVNDGNPGANVRCDTGLDGVCARGITVCQNNAINCTQQIQPGAETCDGLDNDCDGSTDEDAADQPLTIACYDGPANTASVGACAAGTQTCTNGQYGTCDGQVLPTTEICDALDNDCDGSTNEGDPGANVRCDTGLDGVCARGITVCQNNAISCTQQVQPGAETCDGLDNDCDGSTDEDAAGQPLTIACYDGPAMLLGHGACAAGAQTCTDGQFGICDAQVLPGVEVCDGLDNDCDDSTDENNPGGNVQCNTGLNGVCARGVTVCQNNAIACTQQVQPGAESCDGLDNDCDGATDEDAAGQPLSRSCYDGPANTAGVGLCAAGVELCAAGQFGACTNQTTPGAEVCDGEDNDCDGTPDDGNPGAGVACNTGLAGVCAAGATACQNGAIACTQQVTASAETCDGLDNNCNGSIDEGFDVGGVCTNGLGICRRTGIWICDPNNAAGAHICDAVPGPANANELCDYNDDDCDGATDEPFTDGNGVYNQVANCGGCGIDCNGQWVGGPAANHVTPACTVAGNAAVCSFTCINGYFDADGVRDNGCEFQPDPTAIYVATAANGGANNATCGAWDAPCLTITFGLSRAAGTVGKTRVNVSDGLYRENVTLLNGINVYGGYNATSWSRDFTVNVTVISGLTPNPTSVDRRAVSATNITTATEFSGFTVNAESADPGGNSIGVYILNSNGQLVVRDNVINGARGGDGEPGDPGSNGLGGINGGNGMISFVSAANNLTRAGGTAGARTCNGVVVNGGRGGNSTVPVHNARNGGGVTGNTAPGPLGDGGLGGLGAGNFRTYSNLPDGCYVSSGLPITADPGLPATRGMDGGGGAAAANGDGAFNGTAFQWRGLTGGTGTAGDHGGGGGGGGAAAGVNATDTNEGYQYGASGGGGGSGGCGGNAGLGGKPAGASFAIFIAFTGAGPTAVSGLPQLINNRFKRGDGGIGGSGGAGGAGGDSGKGGLGGDGVDVPPYGGCMFDAGIGAEGGRGGHAGGGGGGAGGVSYDIYITNSNGFTRDYAGLNTFELGDTIDTGGPGGTGGTANNTQIGLGDDGPDGAFGRVRFIP